MNNLPRKLIYQDRTALSDFTGENELYREISGVLEGLLHSQPGPHIAAFPAMLEQEILEMFNNAHYYAVLATNDAGALDFFRNFGKYVGSMLDFQVALLILVLQKDKNELQRKVLKQFVRHLNPLLSAVMVKYKSQNRLFTHNLTPCPPPVARLDIDWDEATASFSRDKVEKILSLWHTKDEKKKVLHQIWTAALVAQEESSHSEKCMYIKMLQGALEDGDGTLLDATTYYATVIGTLNRENAALKEENAALKGERQALEVHTAQDTPCDAQWVRLVVDYAKSRLAWDEAKPFRNMLNQLLRGKADCSLFDMVDEIEQHFHREKKLGDVNIDQANHVFVNPQNVNCHG